MCETTLVELKDMERESINEEVIESFLLEVALNLEKPMT